MARCDAGLAEEAAAAVVAAAERRAGGAGIAGVLLAGGLLRDAMLPAQSAGAIRSPACSTFLGVQSELPTGISSCTSTPSPLETCFA